MLFLFLKLIAGTFSVECKLNKLFRWISLRQICCFFQENSSEPVEAAGQVYQLDPQGFIMVKWPSSRVTCCYPQELFVVGDEVRHYFYFDQQLCFCEHTFLHLFVSLCVSVSERKLYWTDFESSNFYQLNCIIFR